MSFAPSRPSLHLCSARRGEDRLAPRTAPFAPSREILWAVVRGPRGCSWILTGVQSDAAGGAEACPELVERGQDDNTAAPSKRRERNRLRRVRLSSHGTFGAGGRGQGRRRVRHHRLE